MLFPRTACLVIFLLLAVATSGCGSKNLRGRLAINGRVTLDGVALDRGAIAFGTMEPDGVSSGAVIQDGVYSISELKGLPPGKYLVRINSVALPANVKTNATVSAPGPSFEVGAERIAPAYNAKSTTVIEVLQGQKNTFDFQVKST